MNRAERIYRLHALLKEKPRSMVKLMEELEASKATVKRDLAYMANLMGAPIQYDRGANGYGYREQAEKFDLPGLWLNESELYALLAAERLLEQMQPGLLAPYIGPLRARIRHLLAQSGHKADTVSRRIVLQPVAARSGHPERFGTVAAALLQGLQLHIHYHGRERDQGSERTVHPHRLLRYRDNWYLLAYCEKAGGLRTFSQDRIQQAELRPDPVRPMANAELDRHLGASFGIFSGTATGWAVLRFSPEASRWVADETWHPDQIGQWAGPHYELQVPYSNPRELLMDILKYGPDVEVVAPEKIREMVAQRLREAAARYRGPQQP